MDNDGFYGLRFQESPFRCHLPGSKKIQRDPNSGCLLFKFSLLNLLRLLSTDVEAI